MKASRGAEAGERRISHSSPDRAIYLLRDAIVLAVAARPLTVAIDIATASGDFGCYYMTRRQHVYDMMMRGAQRAAVFGETNAGIISMASCRAGRLAMS